jgi:hypothetical protein
MSLVDMFYVSMIIGVWAGLIMLFMITYRVYQVTSRIQHKIDSLENSMLSVKSSVLGTALAVFTGFLGRKRRGGGRYE